MDLGRFQGTSPESAAKDFFPGYCGGFVKMLSLDTASGCHTSYHRTGPERESIPFESTFVHFHKCPLMVTFTPFTVGYEGFLFFCILLTSGYVKFILPGMAAVGRFPHLRVNEPLDRKTCAPEGVLEVVWPLYGTGPPVKGP